MENQAVQLRPEYLFDVLRREIEHEDAWIRDRVSWLLAVNGFLFAGYGTTLTLAGQGVNVPEFLPKIKSMLVIFPFVGIGTAVAVWCGVVAPT